MAHTIRRILDRPRTGFLLVFAGVLLLALAPLLPWYVLPRVELSPLNINVTNVTVGSGSYFTGTGMTPTVPITITTHIVGDVAAGEASGDAVWTMATRVDNPQTIGYDDPRLAMQFMVERMAFDRHTNQFVNCCQETPVHQGNAYLKFPFNVSKGTYQYWNPYVKKAFPIRYTGTVTMEGHQLYRFDGTIPATQIGTLSLPGSLLGMTNTTGMVAAPEYYADTGDEVLVDPLSGSPVAVTQHPVTTLRQPGGDKDVLTLSRFTISPSAASERSTLAQAVSGDQLLVLVSSTLPIGLAVLGALVVLLGVLQLLRARRIARQAPMQEQPPAPEPAETTAV